MGKRESSVGLISILLATFGLSIAGIWFAYQLGFNSDTDVEYTYVGETKNTSNQLEPAITETPIATPTPKELKTGDDLATNTVQAQIKFLSDSNKITSEGVKALNLLKQEIIEFEHQTVGIRVHSNIGDSEFGRKIARQRGEEVAGYLRGLGLKNKIVISRRNPNSSVDNISSQPSNQVVVVKLYKL